MSINNPEKSRWYWGEHVSLGKVVAVGWGEGIDCKRQTRTSILAREPVDAITPQRISMIHEVRS